MPECVFNQQDIQVWCGDATTFPYDDLALRPALVLSDLPYHQVDTINACITATRYRAYRVSMYFMALTDIQYLDIKADSIQLWLKQPSTKNTTKKYSDFVEAIATYHSAPTIFTEYNHWSHRTGVFTDTSDGTEWHPHQKPLSLLTTLIRNHTFLGEYLLDCTCGSGSTLLAAALTGRKAIGIEQDRTRALCAVERLTKALVHHQWY